MSPRPPLNPTRPRARGFTLVEILVVVAIIVILMAILIPTAMRAVSSARNTAIAVDIGQLKTAMDDYKKAHGDYPPSMDWDPAYAANFNAQAQKWSQNGAPTAYAYSSICERHLLRCYPKMTAAEKTKFYVYIAPLLDQDEALVFWLAMIANDPREPFKNFALNTNSNPPKLYYAGGNNITQLDFGDFPGSYPRNIHFEFDQRRLVDSDGDGIPGFAAQFCKDTTFMYFDSRTYAFPYVPGYAARQVAEPYTDAQSIATGHPKFMNPNTFQILCAGQDGDYGRLVPDAINNGNFIWANTKMFPNMLNTNEEDSDNLADFTEGRRLIDHRP